MIRPTKTFTLSYMGAGLLLVSLLFLTASPLTLTNLILGIIPLILLLFFGFTIWRAKKKESAGEGTSEEIKED